MIIKCRDRLTIDQGLKPSLSRQYLEDCLVEIMKMCLEWINI